MLTVMTDVSDPRLMTRFEFVELLNEDLSREYSAIIAGVAFSKVFPGSQLHNVALELAFQADFDLKHAIELASWINCFGNTPTVEAVPIYGTSDREGMLRRHPELKTESVKWYAERVSQCKELGEDALADELADVLLQEELHLEVLTSAIRISESIAMSIKQRRPGQLKRYRSTSLNEPKI